MVTEATEPKPAKCSRISDYKMKNVLSPRGRKHVRNDRNHVKSGPCLFGRVHFLPPRGFLNWRALASYLCDILGQTSDEELALVVVLLLFIRHFVYVCEFICEEKLYKKNARRYFEKISKKCDGMKKAGTKMI